MTPTAHETAEKLINEWLAIHECHHLAETPANVAACVASCLKKPIEDALEDFARAGKREATREFVALVTEAIRRRL